MSAIRFDKMLAHFSCEPLYTPEEYILYPGSEDDDPAQVRREKRKRREDIGREILGGKTSVMMTASLRGPFEDGWINPWRVEPRNVEARDDQNRAKKRRREIEDSAKKLPTERKPPPSHAAERSIYNTSPTPNRRNHRSSRPPNLFAPVNSREAEIQAVANEQEFKYRRDVYRATSSSSSSSSRLSLRERVAPFRNAIKEAREHEKRAGKDRVPLMTLSDRDEAAVRLQRVASRLRRNAEAQDQSAEEARVNNRNLANSLLLSSSSASPYSFPRNHDHPAQVYEPEGEAAARARIMTPAERRYVELANQSATMAKIWDPAEPLASLAASLSSSSSSHVSLGQVVEPVGRENPVRAIRRLSFTSSGNTKRIDRRDPPIRENTVPSPNTGRAHFARSNGMNGGGFSSTDDPILTSNGYNDELLRELDAQPEAQIISGGPGMAGAGPSTNLLETDKYLLNEEDSYADLSPQAAMSKAQHSLTRDLLIPPLNEGRPNGFHAIESELPEAAVPQAGKRRTTATAPVWNPPEYCGFFNPHGQDPMSTQAMVDGLSPFPMTTVKKEKHTGSGYPRANTRDEQVHTSPLLHRGGASIRRHPNYPLRRKGSPSIPRHRTSFSPDRRDKEIPIHTTSPHLNKESQRPASPSSPVGGPSPGLWVGTPEPTSPYSPLHSSSPAPANISPLSNKASAGDSKIESPSLSPYTVRNGPSFSLRRSPPPPPAPSGAASVPVSLPPIQSPSTNSHSLPSFSIAANGTLTEISAQQDGQAQQPVPRLSSSAETTGEWSVEAAIEDAGNFLGNWDVDAEARKEGERAAAAVTAAVTAANTTNSADARPPRRARITRSFDRNASARGIEELEAIRQRIIAGSRH